MEEKRDGFLLLDLAVTFLAAAGGWAMISEARRYLSFAGFAALFELVILVPGFICLIVEIILFLFALQGRRRYAKAAYIVQIVCGVPYVRLFFVDVVLFGVLGVFGVLMVMGVIGVIRR